MVSAHWGAVGALSTEAMRSINNLLAPTVTIRSGLGAKVARAEAELLVLTQRQVAAVAMMRSVRRAVFYGGPGTGKTVLAVDRARSLAEQGAKVLLTCFNEPLANRLVEETKDQPNVKATTFHRLCFEIANAAGTRIPQDRNDTWWQLEAPNLLYDAGTEGVSFDALVIDEAQDFFSDWFMALQCLLDQNRETSCTCLRTANRPSIEMIGNSPKSLCRSNWT